MDYKGTLKEKIELHNQVFQQLEQLTAQRNALLGQIELLKEIIDSEEQPQEDKT